MSERKLIETNIIWFVNEEVTMCDAIVTHDMLHLNERESAQLARAVQILVQELGFDPEAVDRSYNESMAFFLKKDHVAQTFSGDARFAGRSSPAA
jgi:hypothetical protein